jgi:hypothetical protein
MRERLAAASDAAERLIASAGDSRRRRPPPAGWQAPGSKSAAGTGDLERLLASARLLGELVPPEALERLSSALRELLLALRALIDFYLERLERTRSEPDRVQDIPIK